MKRGRSLVITGVRGKGALKCRVERAESSNYRGKGEGCI